MNTSPPYTSLVPEEVQAGPSRRSRKSRLRRECVDGEGAARHFTGAGTRGSGREVAFSPSSFCVPLFSSDFSLLHLLLRNDSSLLVTFFGPDIFHNLLQMVHLLQSPALVHSPTEMSPPTTCQGQVCCSRPVIHNQEFTSESLQNQHAWPHAQPS